MKTQITETGSADNETIVKRFIEEVLNSGNLDRINEFWAPDMTWHGGSLGEVHGIENYTAMLKGAQPDHSKKCTLLSTIP